MAARSASSKTQLIDTLRSTGAETAARLRSLPPEAFEQGRYENGWNGRQILAHIAALEWTYPRPIGRPPLEGGQHGSPGHLPKEPRHSDRPRLPHDGRKGERPHHQRVRGRNVLLLRAGLQADVRRGPAPLHRRR